MPEKSVYTAYYEPVRLKAWFYVEVLLMLCMLAGIVYGVTMVLSGKGERRDWISLVHIILLISISDRVIKRYRKSKINYCYIAVDQEGISWRLPVESYKAPEKEIIVWQDIKKVIIDENGITIKYMSTYFTDTIPFATIGEQDKEQLLTVLREQLNSRSIVSEDRQAA